MIEPMPLWSTPADADPLDVPTLNPYPAEDGRDGPTVIICPGGSYRKHGGSESLPVVEWLNSHGINAAILHYRLGPRHNHPAMIHDAQRGIRMVRDHLRLWGIRNTRVGVMGFSAGGHLTSTLAVHHDKLTHDQDDLAAVHSARPDAIVLCYPVTDMGPTYGHDRSRLMLLGENPDPQLIELLTTHKHVTAKTPPTFLWQTADDRSVPVENSLLFAAACRKHRVPVEYHMYESGPHGRGMSQDIPYVKTWIDHCIPFLQRHLM